MKKINKIVIGTNNEGKFEEMCQLLPSDLEKISLSDHKAQSPAEIGTSFCENSVIKARHFSRLFKLPCLSDDSGLEVDILNNQPGIFSSRWAGEKKNFTVAIDKVLNEMKKKDTNWKTNNKAKFVCSLTLYWPDDKFVLSNGIINGKIVDQKRGDNGFGYDPIFVPDGFKQTFGEMKLEKKMKIDHRSKAFKFLNIIYFNQFY